MPATPVLQLERQVIGTDRSYPLRIRSQSRAVITSYKVDNPLSAKIWRGDNLPTVATPAISWKNPGQGTVTLTVSAADIAGLEPGRYEAMCYVGEPGGRLRAFAHFALQLVASPGMGAAGKVYGTLDEMAVYYPALLSLPAAATDQANYAEQRAEARRWIDRWIEDHPGTLTRAEVRSALAADGLVVTSLVSEIAAKRAIAIVLGGQVTTDAAAVSAGRKSAYEPDRKRFADEADALIRTLVAEMGDGTTIDAREPAEGSFVISRPTGRLSGGILRVGRRGGRWFGC